MPRLSRTASILLLGVALIGARKIGEWLFVPTFRVSIGPAVFEVAPDAVEGDVVSARFLLENTGRSDARLRLQGTCGCTSFSVAGKQDLAEAGFALPAGGGCDVEAKVSTSGRSGPQSVGVTVLRDEADGGLSAVAHCTIRYRVSSRLFAESNPIVFTECAVGKEYEKFVDLFDMLPEPAPEVKSVSSDNPDVSVRFENLPRKEAVVGGRPAACRCRLHVTYTARRPSDLQSTLAVTLNDGKPPVEIGVACRSIRAPLWITPECVYIESGDVGQAWTRSALIVARSDVALGDLRISAPTGVKVEMVRQSGNAQALRLSMSDAPGRLDEDWVVRIDHNLACPPLHLKVRRRD